jgi:hypothetical protein
MSPPNGFSIGELGKQQIMIAARQTEYLVRELSALFSDLKGVKNI